MKSMRPETPQLKMALLALTTEWVLRKQKNLV
jgi:hypothetical protein